MRPLVDLAAGFARAVALLTVVRPSAPAFARAGDADDDGISNQDEDLDGDGQVADQDSDGDDIPNWQDADDDGDGIHTIDEDADGDGDPSDDFTDVLGVELGPDYLNEDVPRDRDHDDHDAVAWGGDDCDDERAGIHPDIGHDPLYDGEDWDCDGGAYEFDGDRDGWESRAEAGGDDCNDYDPSVHPGAEEDSPPGDEIDRDCDGWIDPVGTLVPNGGCDCDNSGSGRTLLGVLCAIGALVTGRRRR